MPEEARQQKSEQESKRQAETDLEKRIKALPKSEAAPAPAPEVAAEVTPQAEAVVQAESIDAAQTPLAETAKDAAVLTEAEVIEKSAADAVAAVQVEGAADASAAKQEIAAAAEEPVTLTEWTDADDAAAAGETETETTEEEAEPPLPPHEVVRQVMETLTAEDIQNPDKLYNKIADIIDGIGPEAFGIKADAPAECVDRLVDTYYRYTLDSIEQMLQQGVSAKRAEDAKREGKFTAFLKRNVRNIVSGGLFGIGRKAGMVAVIGGAAYLGVGIGTMGAGLIVGAGIGAGMGAWEYMKSRGAGKDKLSYLLKKQKGRVARLARELGLAPATVEGGTPGEDEEGPLSAEATFMKKMQEEVANGVEALVTFDLNRTEELLRVEETSRRLRDEERIGPMEWGDVDELIQLTRDARTLDAKDIKRRQELIRKLMEEKRGEGGVERESCMRVLMREMVADEFERLWQDNLIPAKDKDDEARMKQQYQREAVYSIELQMNALLGDIVAQEKFEEIDERSKAAYERGYIGQLLGEEPPDSIWMAMGKGAVSGFFGGAMMYGGGAALGAGVYRGLTTLRSSARQELLKLVQKEEQGKDATIKLPGQIIGELQKQKELLSSTNSAVTTTLEAVRAAIEEARARVKLPDLKELDRVRIEQEIAALQRQLVLADVTTTTAESVSAAAERILAARQQAIEMAGALAKEAHAKRSWFGEKGLKNRLLQFIEKGSREEVGKFFWKVGTRTIEAAIVTAGVGFLTEWGVEKLGLFTADERVARDAQKAMEERERQFSELEKGHFAVRPAGAEEKLHVGTEEKLYAPPGIENGEVRIEKEGIVEYAKVDLTESAKELIDRWETEGKGVDWSRLKTDGVIGLDADKDFFRLGGSQGTEGVVRFDTERVNGHEALVIKMMTHAHGGGAGETWHSTAAVIEDGKFNGLIRGATKTGDWRPEAGQEVQRTDDSYVKMDYNNDGNVDETVTATKFEGNRYGEDWAAEAERASGSVLHLKAVDVEAPIEKREYEYSSTYDGRSLFYTDETYVGTVQTNAKGEFIGTRMYGGVAFGAVQRGDRDLWDATRLDSAVSAKERMALYDKHFATLEADPLVVSNGQVSYWDSGARRHEQWNVGTLENVTVVEQVNGEVELRFPDGTPYHDRVHIGPDGELMIGDLSASRIAAMALEQNIEREHPWALGAGKEVALRALGFELDRTHATLPISDTVIEHDLERIFRGDKGIWSVCGGDPEKLRVALVYDRYDTPDKVQALFDAHTQFSSEAAMVGLAAFADFNTADKLLRFPEGQHGAVVRMKGQDYLIENGTIAAVKMEVAGGHDRVAKMGPVEKLSDVTEAEVAKHLASTREAFAEQVAAQRIQAEKSAPSAALSRAEAESILTARAGERGMEALHEAGVQHGFLKADVPREAMNAIAGMKAIDANSMDDDAFAKHVIKEQGLSRWKGYDDNLRRVHDLIEDRIDTLQAAGKWDPNTMTVRDVLTATERASMVEIVDAKKELAPASTAAEVTNTEKHVQEINELIAHGNHQEAYLKADTISDPRERDYAIARVVQAEVESGKMSGFGSMIAHAGDIQNVEIRRIADKRIEEALERASIELEPPAVSRTAEPEKRPAETGAEKPELVPPPTTIETTEVTPTIVSESNGWRDDWLPQKVSVDIPERPSWNEGGILNNTALKEGESFYSATEDGSKGTVAFIAREAGLRIAHVDGQGHIDKMYDPKYKEEIILSPLAQRGMYQFHSVDGHRFGTLKLLSNPHEGYDADGVEIKEDVFSPISVSVSPGSMDAFKRLGFRSEALHTRGLSFSQNIDVVNEDGSDVFLDSESVNSIELDDATKRVELFLENGVPKIFIADTANRYQIFRVESPTRIVLEQDEGG